MELRCLSNLMYFQSVPGTGDKDKEEDKGMTIEEKKEAERQRWEWAWMYIMDAQVGLKTTALPFFLNFFPFPSCSRSVWWFLIGWQCWNLKCLDKFLLNQLDWFGKCCVLVKVYDLNLFQCKYLTRGQMDPPSHPDRVKWPNDDLHWPLTGLSSRLLRRLVSDDGWHENLI